MVEVIVFTEGQTEEQFIKRVVAPAFRQLAIYIKPQLLATSKTGRGGAVSLDRLKFNARNTLRNNQRVVLTTLLDLYGLDTDFPHFEAAKTIADVQVRCETLEHALHEEVVSAVGCVPDRFIPYIQPYEFEGLLFSDVSALVMTDPQWPLYQPALQAIRNKFPTPEHINNSYATKPSKRLEQVLSPTYHKTRHGPLAAENVTLAVMERECAHFRGWLNQLRSLAAR
nr:DUF4276 family protein [uncultured Deefgea sp.]